MTTTALPLGAARDRRLNWSWLGILPFLVFSLMFLLLPALNLIIGAFQDATGQFTLQNIVNLGQPAIIRSYTLSLEISLASALGGVLLGFALALAAILGGLPRWVRPTLMTFSGVASQFAGVPLAFAFLATLGRTGLVTALLMTIFDWNIYHSGFNLLSFWGLTLTYLYFQIPLMVLVISPALDGLKREWREAAATLGATGFQYWSMIALPILLPSLLGAFLLLFANAFGAIATAYALTGSSFNIVTILLYAQIRGDALHDPNLGYALALGMIVITGVSNGAYIWLASRSARWIR